jgi:inosine-uridine nucleoside N-ribohydrolase
MAKPLLLDVDTGIDDAIAIALATTLVQHELVGVTTVAGNVSVDDATRNTLNVLEWIGADVPVYRGMSGPLVRLRYTAREHHGQSGLGGWSLPEPRGHAQETTAPEAIVSLARRHRGDITFVFVGPLTNLAVALSLEPRLPSLVTRLVIMGGSFFNPGNVRPHAEFVGEPFAEFNVYADPDAAAAVAQSSFNATWIGLDVTHKTRFTREHWQQLRDASESPRVLVREVLRRSFEELGRQWSPLHDPLAVSVAERPDIVGLEHGAVRVNLAEARRGETRLAIPGPSDVTQQVAAHVDFEAFASVFYRLCPIQP